MKKFILIFISLAIIVGLWVVVTMLLGSPSSPSDETVITPQAENMVDVPSYVYDIVEENVIRNFAYDVVLFYEDERVSMLYYGQTDSFLLSLNTVTQLEADVTYAERAFLSTLSISPAQACALRVEIVVPHYLDFENAGAYNLSFCSENAS